MNTLDIISKLNQLDIRLKLVNDQIEIDAPKGVLNKDLLSMLKENRKKIIDFLKEAPDRIHHKSINITEKREYYELSSAQKRMFFLQQFDLDSTSYNIANVLEIKRNIKIDKLEETFEKLIIRHDSLRTSFEVIKEQPVQRIHKEVEFKIKKYKVNGESQETFKGSVEAIIERFVRPFDLRAAPLLRVGVIEFNDKSILLIDMHHIISDGMSYQLLKEEFELLYADTDLPELRLQYKDYACWQNSKEQKDLIKKKEEYWIKNFSDELPVLHIPTDYPRPLMQSFEGSSMEFKLDTFESKKLNEIAREIDATLYMVILSIFTILLSRLSSQEDIIIGSVTAGRSHVDLDNIIGMFVNTLAMRNYPNREKSYKKFLQEVKLRTLEVYENQEYQYEDLVDKLSVSRDTSRNPLFDVMYVLQNMDRVGAVENESNIVPFNYDDRISKFDLTLSCFEDVKGINFTLEYCTKLFRKETIKSFIKYFKEIILSILKDTDIRISDIEILTDREKEQLLNAFNDTEVDYPRDKTVQELFEEQVSRTPDNMALVFEDNEITFRVLNESSNQLALVLRDRGVKPDSMVGIMVDRSIEMMVGILGILKSGGAYLPIDAEYPEERIRYMLKDSSAELLLTERKYIDHLGEAFPTLLADDNGIYINIDKSHKNVENINTSRDLAYIMYTSGSMGIPKSVMVEHMSINRLVLHSNYVELSKDTRILQTGAPVFDATTFEIWGSLLNGGQLFLVRKEEILDAHQLAISLIKNDINTLWLSAPLFNQLFDENKETFSPLTYLVVGGDILSPWHINQVRRTNKELKVVNGYGPTENTTFSVCHLIDREYNDQVPIGRPISNSSAYIYDKGKQLVPIGVKGELYVGGDGVSRGYLNNLELTSESFIDNPNGSGGRLYCTGDLARWQPDGIIEFFGRIDNQVKIRGFRIELGEIESQLLKHELIRDVIVLSKEDEKRNRYLCAYIVCGEGKREEGRGSKGGGSAIDISELREYLARSLPEYMVPSYFIQIEKIPLTANGKVDRRLLPEPDRVSEEEYIAPRNEIEEKLLETWREVLGLEKIGIKDNFFLLGGDSIKTIQISAKLRKYGYSIEMRDIFQYQTIMELAPFIKKIEGISDQSAITGEVKLTPIQRWFFKDKNSERHHFNQSVMFYSVERISKEAISAIFSKLQEHHDALRMRYIEDNGEVKQINGGLDYPLSLEEFDLKTKKDAKKELERRVNEIQASINLANGPLMKLGLFHLEDGDRLLIVIHHLVIDGVSWRILFEDIETLYNQYKKGETLDLPSKTDSFKLWSEKLSEYSNSELFLREKSYWIKIDSIEVSEIKKDFEVEGNFMKDTESVSFSLSKEETNALLTKVNEPFKTEINDILLAGLGIGIRETFGSEKVLVAMEGHGREEIIGGMDITRTIGWFTSIYPVILDMTYTDDLARQIKEVKESLHQVPDKGIGYGILKYLTSESNRSELEFKLKPQIGFNYLGQFDEDIAGVSFGIAKESPGNEISSNNERDYEIDISGMISKGQMGISIYYNNGHYRSETMEQLRSHFKNALTDMIKYCLEKEEKELTPSDLTYKNLSIKDIEDIKALFN
jgi:amino acid adenylation domain-containing protein/non-ribosomal peptide synthase protein (TIGR01720 family)